MMDVAAGIVDDRGWSVADYINGVDEGGAAGPPMHGGTAGPKANQARRKRQKEGYSLLSRTQASESIKNELQTNHFQNPLTAIVYLRNFRSPTDALTLRNMKKGFNTVDLLHNIGVNENSVTLLVNLLRFLNNKLPAANRNNRFSEAVR